MAVNPIRDLFDTPACPTPSAAGDWGGSAKLPVPDAPEAVQSAELGPQAQIYPVDGAAGAGSSMVDDVTTYTHVIKTEK